MVMTCDDIVLELVTRSVITRRSVATAEPAPSKVVAVVLEVPVLIPVPGADESTCLLTRLAVRPVLWRSTCRMWVRLFPQAVTLRLPDTAKDAVPSVQSSMPGSPADAVNIIWIVDDSALAATVALRPVVGLPTEPRLKPFSMPLAAA
jgi:hypothetical protein